MGMYVLLIVTQKQSMHMRFIQSFPKELSMAKVSLLAKKKQGMWKKTQSIILPPHARIKLAT